MIIASASIYCSPNQWGYRYNVNHPKINELYHRYAIWKGIVGRPMTDKERFDFEAYIDTLVVKN